MVGPQTEGPIPRWEDTETRLREVEEENRRLREQLAGGESDG